MLTLWAREKNKSHLQSSRSMESNANSLNKDKFFSKGLRLNRFTDSNTDSEQERSEPERIHIKESKIDLINIMLMNFRHMMTTGDDSLTHWLTDSLTQLNVNLIWHLRYWSTERQRTDSLMNHNNVWFTDSINNNQTCYYNNDLINTITLWSVAALLSAPSDQSEPGIRHRFNTNTCSNTNKPGIVWLNIF